MALENSMLVMNGKQVGGNTQDLTGYQTKVDNNLETESKEIAGAINELRSEKADTDIVAADFNTGTSYTAGNYCIYEGKFYKFKANHSGAWSAADVDEIKIAGELASLKSGLISLNSKVDGDVDTTSVSGVTIMKVGRMVYMSISTWHEVFTMPTKYRPLADAYFAVRSSLQGSGNDIVTYLSIGVDGSMSLGTNDTFVGALSWIAGNLD